MNGFSPAIGNSFQVMTFGSRTGQFATINGTALGNGKRFSPAYSATNLTLNVTAPSASVAAMVSAWFINEGARQLQAYADYPAGQGGYVPINDPLVTGFPGTSVVDVNRWQRLTIANALDQNGNPVGPTQTYLGAQWLGARPFALGRTDAALPWIDPGPQPRLGGVAMRSFAMRWWRSSGAAAN